MLVFVTLIVRFKKVLDPSLDSRKPRVVDSRALSFVNGC